MSPVHLGDALQVGDLGLQGLDVSEGLTLVLLLSLQCERAAVHVHGVEAGQLTLQLGFGLLAALQEGLNIGCAQQLVSSLVLQLLDPLPPADTRDRDHVSTQWTDHFTKDHFPIHSNLNHQFDLRVSGLMFLPVGHPPLSGLDLSLLTVSALHQLLRHPDDVIQLATPTCQLSQEVL